MHTDSNGRVIINAIRNALSGGRLCCFIPNIRNILLCVHSQCIPYCNEYIPDAITLSIHTYCIA